MAEAIVLRVAKLLDDFPNDGELWGAGGEFSELKKTVSFLQSIVPDAEKRRFREPWLGDVKDAFYDAEDLLEEWNLEFTRREPLSKYEKLKHRVITSFPPLILRASRPRMSTRAKKIRKRIEAIAARGRDLGLRECAEVVRVERRERLGSFVYDEEIIGREDAKNAIMNFLLDSDGGISVVIYGESGIGKTAFVRCLYEDEMFKKHFDLRIWFNDFCNLEGELRKISGRETTEREDDVLQLQKYLLVTEDLGLEDALRWRSLERLLIEGARGTKGVFGNDFVPGN